MLTAENAPTLDRLRPDDPLKVSLRNDRPATIEGVKVDRIVEHHRISPHCWASHKQCESWTLEAGGRRFEIYEVDDGWFFMKYLD